MIPATDIQFEVMTIYANILVNNTENWSPDIGEREELIRRCGLDWGLSPKFSFGKQQIKFFRQSPKFESREIKNPIDTIRGLCFLWCVIVLTTRWMMRSKKKQVSEWYTINQWLAYL